MNMEKMNLLQPEERLDDLERDGLKIIQNPAKFCFGIDAVLLTDFAKVKPKEKLLDIGTGTAVIPILLSAKTDGEFFTGLEIQHDMAEMAKRSIIYNGLEDRVAVVEGDVRDCAGLFANESMDVITCNPPYMNDEHGLQNPDECKRIARHEVACTLEDVLREGARILKTGGRYYMIHRPFRLADIIDTMRKMKLEPKRIRMVHPFIDKDANMVLIEAVKGGGRFMVVEKPLIVYTKDNKRNI